MSARAVEVRKPWDSLARFLCQACGVFAARLFFDRGSDVGIGNWCPICRANIEHAGALT